MHTEQHEQRPALRRISVVGDDRLVAELREHQKQLERITGLKPSLSATAVRLLRKGMEREAAKAA